MSDKVCIYHGNCIDGFTSAWVVRTAIGTNKRESDFQNLGRDIDFVAGVYGNAPPDVTGKTVYIVDFSYKRPIMEEIVKKAKKVVHIDHHDTAIRDMAGFSAPNFDSLYSYENTESGAMLTWKYFFPSRPVPKFILHVDDQDRWQFKLPGTREINSSISSYDYSFENWDMLISQRLDALISEGTTIERHEAKIMKELMECTVRKMKIAGHIVSVANIPYMFGSDMCHALAKNQPFAAYYYDGPEYRNFGLRSTEDGLHVGDVAAIYGGGGHARASGFRLTHEEATKLEIQ